MVHQKIGKVLLVGLLVTGTCLLIPVQAHARSGDTRRGHDRGYPRYDRYPYGRLAVSLPHGSIEIGYSGRKYFFQGGLFYRPNAREYVIVPPPAGVVVYAIPDGHHRVMIDGATYYTYNGIYYSRIPQGYQVVDPPSQVIVEPATVASSFNVEKVQEDFTMNIPNAKRNGYVSVIIRRSGNGFVGPQGEFYSEFPKVAQLQVIYAK